MSGGGGAAAAAVCNNCKQMQQQDISRTTETAEDGAQTPCGKHTGACLVTDFTLKRDI